MQPYYDDGLVTLYLGDAREILPTLPKVGLILTDPPYAIGAGRGEWIATGGDASDAEWEAARMRAGLSIESLRAALAPAATRPVPPDPRTCSVCGGEWQEDAAVAPDGGYCGACEDAGRSYGAPAAPGDGALPPGARTNEEK